MTTGVADSLVVRAEACKIHRMSRLRAIVAGLTLMLALAPVASAQTPDAAAVVHAKQIFDLLEQDKAEDVAKQFNAQMTAALPPDQLRTVWTTVHQQAGEFKAYVDQRVTTPAPGVTAVVLGCQFEKMVGNFVVAFDGDGKIAGLRITPRAAPAAPAAPPPSSHFAEESVTVGSGDWSLPGTLSMPTGPVVAAVVLVHGSGPNDRDETIGPNKPFRDLAWGLADRGIAVLRYDKRTRVHAAKMAGSTTMTVRDETIDDALLAAALLRHRDRIDPKKIFVLGHSLGGTLGPRIAAADPSLAGLVIMAGATRSLLDAAREPLTYLSTLNPGAVNVDQALAQLRRAAPESYWKDLDAYNPVQTAATLSMPILILQGERDYQVTMTDLRGWRDGLGERKTVTINTYPTLNHLFIAGEGKSTPAEYERPGHVSEIVLDDIAGWIKTR